MKRKYVVEDVDATVSASDDDSDTVEMDANEVQVLVESCVTFISVKYNYTMIQR